MKQPVYVIDKVSVMDAINEAEANKNYFSLAYGISSPDNMKVMVSAIFGENDYVHVSKIANRFRALETAKMIKNANAAIDQILRVIQLKRVKES